MDKKLENMVLLGTATRPHGIKGGFSFNLENTQDSVLKSNSTFYAMPLKGSTIPTSGQEYKIKSISFGNKVIVYLEGINDRNITESILPFEIYISRDELPETDEDEFYMTDIIGMDVYDIEAEKIVGRVTKYFDNGAHIVLITKVDGKSVDIPFVDHFVKEVNLEDNRVECIIPKLM